MDEDEDSIIRYIVTGRAAHERVGRLLRRVVDEEEAANEVEGSNVDNDRGGRQSAVTTTMRWIDLSPYATTTAASSFPMSDCDSIGSAAHADNNNGSQDDSNNNNIVVLDFLWENAPRHETKLIRDYAKCYSHLPNGSILDDKWALARLMGHSSSLTSGIAAGGHGNIRRGGHGERRTRSESNTTTTNNNIQYYLATLESHCFRGTNGFEIFANRVGLLHQPPPTTTTTLLNNVVTTSTSVSTADDQSLLLKYQFDDLILRSSTTTTPLMTMIEDSIVGPPPMPSNLWVIKDSNSNGAGGIWIVDESNIYDFIPHNNDLGNSSSYHDDDDGTNSSLLPIEIKPTKISATSILNPNHRYVAQRYAWPPTLYSGRKCHVRAYALLTCDGCAYLHRRAFLHVANEPFSYNTGGSAETVFDPSIHITNCCANSHDATKFTGEICADLESVSCTNNSSDNDNINNDNNEPLPLGEYLPSISASVALIASSFRPFLRGGDANNGFEYLGLDFILSSVEVDEEDCQRRRLPVAYLLEINAPPSQDTATGLRHAEMLHDDVISDLLRLWVLPNVATTTGDNNVVCDSSGGWKCVYIPPSPNSTIANDDIATTTGKSKEERSNLILPSKAAILNRIHWAIFESRVSKEYKLYWKKYDQQKHDELILLSSSSIDTDINFCESLSCNKVNNVSSFLFGQRAIDDFVIFVRSQFPYYSTASYADDVIDNTTRDNNSSSARRHPTIFFESGGGAQMPHFVADAMYNSVCYRDRSVIGSQVEREARIALALLLINKKDTCTSLRQRHSLSPTNKDDDEYVTILGSNATSLLDLLAQRMFASGILFHGDEIVIASENHLANVSPWLDFVAKINGKVQVKWWTVDATATTEKQSSCILSDLITKRTRIVAISHVSNILGLERDISAICELVHRITKGKGHVIVDGVAAAPHFLSSSILSGIFSPTWYVASLHKLFGPHLGCLLGKRSALLQMTDHLVNDTMCGEDTEKYSALSFVSNETLAKSWNLGTANYEACSGAAALLIYVVKIGMKACATFDIGCHKCSTQQASNQISSESAEIESSSTVYLNIVSTCIHHVENRLVSHLMGYFSCVPLVRIIEDVGKMKVVNNLHGNRIGRRVPIICFTHANISSQTIVKHCRHYGVICRSCKFLATDRLLDELEISKNFVRFSLAHYNTLEEIDESIRVLELLAGWN